MGPSIRAQVASDVRSLTVQIGKITTLIEMWTQVPPTHLCEQKVDPGWRCL